jgi:hypothetical protein
LPVSGLLAQGDRREGGPTIGGCKLASKRTIVVLDLVI